MDASAAAKRILQNTPIFLSLCNILVSAANESVYHPEYLEKRKWIQLAPILTEGILRYNASPPQQNTGICDFHPGRLYLYGGSAMNAYYLSAKQNDGDPSFQKEYADIERAYTDIRIPPTSDIDATWWPLATPITQNGKLVVPVIQSPLFEGIANAYKERLTFHMNMFAELFKPTLLFILGTQGTITVNITTRRNDYVGVWTIKGMFLVQTPTGLLTLDLLDVSIHDGASSQITYPNTKLNIKEKNITHIPTVKQLKIQEGEMTFFIPVPAFWTFIEQQIFLIKNYVQMIWDNKSQGKITNEKIYKAYVRLLFCNYLLNTLFTPIIQPDIRNKVYTISQKTLRNVAFKKEKFYPRMGLYNIDVDSKYMVSVQQIVIQFFKEDKKGVAACIQDTLQQCGANPYIVAELCREKKYLKESHCQSGGKTRKRTKKAPQTRRNPTPHHRSLARQ